MFPAKCVIFVVFCLLIIADGNDARNEDICGPHNGRRVYLELGEQGSLYAKDVTFVENEMRQGSPRFFLSNSSHHRCSLELVTCPSCVIDVTFKSLALSHHCGDGTVTVDSPCRCDYVWISEPPYEDVSGTPYCGLYAPLTYRSSTRTLSISLFYSQSHKDAFTIEYVAERNRIYLKGTDVVSAGLNSTGGGILTSPFFPARYPRDLGSEYVITCPAEAPSCRIRVLFSDFQLASVSIMEFYDGNGQRLDVSSGSRFRPPLIMSSGASLVIRFYANGGTGLGYKAFYSFVMGRIYDKSVQLPITDCGGYVENLGGAITMMDMVGQGVKTYDCVWLIRPPKNFLHMKTHMYLKVISFADMAGNTELIIKQGPTSALLPLEVIRHPAGQLQAPRYREHIAPITSGFHVSLRGTFGPTSHLAIAYTAFSYMDCFTGSDFLCQNHRCIPRQMNCDGFDHCGDNSDEPTTCFRDWELGLQDRKWHMNKANYYFPKIDQYPDLKVATFVFVGSSIGLIILISGLIVLLYRMGTRARRHREQLQSRLQTISELFVFDIADGARIDEISVEDDPPDYEAPPGYDEVIKVAPELEGVRRKRRRSVVREGRNRNSPSRCSYDLDAQSSSSLMVEDASTGRCSQTTPIAAAVRQQIPESPPPPYVTPPGTLRILFGLSSSNETREQPERLANGAGIRVRRGRLRRNSEVSRSLPTIEHQRRQQRLAKTPSSSIDAELLGSYLQAYALSSNSNSNSSCSSEASSIRQLNDRYDEREDFEDAPDAQGTKALAALSIECSCEGACGCANGINPNDLDVATTISPARRVDESLTTARSSEHRDEGNSSTKSAIIRLLGSGSKAKVSSRLSQSMSSTTGSAEASTSASTSASTPCETLGRSFRKLSVCSPDGYATKVSAISACNSYEKLHDELEPVSETTSVGGNVAHSSTTTRNSRSIDMPRNAEERESDQKRRYSSSDLENICEGIKVLDSFLARTGLSASYPRTQSVTVMLFGTPKHSPAISVNTAGNEEASNARNPFWHPPEDGLSLKTD